MVSIILSLVTLHMVIDTSIDSSVLIIQLQQVCFLLYIASIYM
jgi:hypothetical protein